MISTNDYIELLRKSVRIFDYFRRLFDDGLQFSFSPGNIRHEEFGLWILEDLILKEQVLISSAEREVHRRIDAGDLRV